MQAQQAGHPARPPGHGAAEAPGRAPRCWNNLAQLPWEVVGLRLVKLKTHLRPCQVPARCVHPGGSRGHLRRRSAAAELVTETPQREPHRPPHPGGERARERCTVPAISHRGVQTGTSWWSSGQAPCSRCREPGFDSWSDTACHS